MKRLLAPVIVLLAATSAHAELVVVPFDVQVPLLLKALTYDRNLKARAGDQARIAVCRSGRSAQPLHARVNRSHRRHHAPAMPVQVARRGEPEPS